MVRKYMMIFLMGLLCLVCSGKLQAQYCVSLKYDDNGNRTKLSVGRCFIVSRGDGGQDVIDEEISVSDNVGLVVYPNPSKGLFKIEIDDEGEMDNVAILQIYDNRGVLISNCEFVKTANVDISGNPAGLYLLRIIKGGDVYSRMLVKL